MKRALTQAVLVSVLLLGVTVMGSPVQASGDAEAERLMRVSQAFGYGPSVDTQATRLVQLSRAFGYGRSVNTEADKLLQLSRAFGYGAPEVANRPAVDSEAERLLRLSRAFGYGVPKVAFGQQPTARDSFNISVVVLGGFIAATAIVIGWGLARRMGRTTNGRHPHAA